MNSPKNKKNLNKEQINNIKTHLPKIIKSFVMAWMSTAITLRFFFLLIASGMNPFQAQKIILEQKVGLKVDSIISNPLYFPESQDSARLQFKSATAGRWNTYDFRKKNRIKLIDEPNHFSGDVDLVFFPIEDIDVNSESDIDQLTPDNLFQLFYFDHIIHFTRFSISEALEYWVIRETTYADAYDRVWDNGWIKDVQELWIAEKLLYQVTPKWNTLIFPWRKWWDKTPPLPDGQSEFPEWELSPIWVRA